MKPSIIAPRLTIAALVTDEEFSRLTMLADTYELVRVVNLDHLRDLFLAGTVAGAFVGTRPLSDTECARDLSKIAKSFPFYPMVGLLVHRPSGAQVDYAFRYGRVGVSRVVEISQNYAAAQKAFTEIVDPFLGRAVAAVCEGVGSASFRRFLTECFRPEVTASQQLFNRIGVHPSTGISRFYRAGLPAPKQYIAWATLAYAAHLGRMPGLAMPQIAHRVHASSPQSFGRTIKAMTGLTGSEFRKHYNGESMVAMYRKQLIEPYLELLATFDPSRDRVGATPDRDESELLSA